MPFRKLTGSFRGDAKKLCYRMVVADSSIPCSCIVGARAALALEMIEYIPWAGEYTLYRHNVSLISDARI